MLPLIKKVYADINPPQTPEQVITVVQRLGGYLYTLIIVVGVVVILMGAFNILTSGGDEKKFSKGKNQIFYAAIAVAVAILATGIIKIVEDLLNVNA